MEQVYVCIHFVSFEGEIGELKVYKSKTQAQNSVKDSANTDQDWREWRLVEIE